MMSARTSFLVWWGLPILCAGFGAFVAAYAGEGGEFGRGPGQVGPMLLIACYFALVGLLVFIFRVRQNQVAFDDRERYDKPMEAAMVALCAPILAAGIWFMAANFHGAMGTSHTISGKLQSIDQVGAFGRTYGLDLDSTATPLMLECHLQHGCGSPVQLLSLKPGTPVKVEMLNSKLIGLSADGKVLVDAGVQRRWRMLLSGGGMALLIIYASTFIAVSLRLLFGEHETEDETPSFWTAT